MNINIKKTIKLATAFVIFFMTLFLVNQIFQFYQLLNIANPYIGSIFLISSVIFFFGIIFYLIYTFLKYSKKLIKPENEDKEEYSEYIQNVCKRLNNNKLLQVNGVIVNNKQEIEDALEILEKEANQIIKENSSWVFVSTAISQNGKLDGLITFFIQMRMVYQIAKIYYQRPHLSELYTLYSNVIVSSFFVSQIEEIDISDQLDPIITKLGSKSLIGKVPGIGEGINLLTNMLFEGAANCFLTLRVGIITRKYCDFLSHVEKRKIRRSTISEAAGMLGNIISNNSEKIMKAFLRSLKKLGYKAVDNTKDNVVKVFDNLKDKFKKFPG